MSVALSELLHEYLSTQATIHDGAVNLNDRAYSFRFCTSRARVCLSQANVSEGNIAGGGLAYEIIAILHGSIAS